MTMPCKHQRGFTMVELVAFIVIAGIVSVALLQVFSGTMRGSHLGKEMTQATQLAQQRMEVIAGQRERLGYSGFDATSYDPCQLGLWAGSPEVCSTTTYGAGNFSVISTAPVADSCGTGCTSVTVTVASPYGATRALLTRQFWDY